MFSDVSIFRVSLLDRLICSAKLGDHPKSSVYNVLNRLKKKGDGVFVKKRVKGKIKPAFQLLEKKAPLEEVRMLRQLLSGEWLDEKAQKSSVEQEQKVMVEAAKDLQALASKYRVIQEEIIGLLKNWHKARYVKVREYFLRTLYRILIKAKEKGVHETLEKMKSTVDKIVNVAKNPKETPDIRRLAWHLLIVLEEPLKDIAFEILETEEEKSYDVVRDFVTDEIKAYAKADPIDAKSKLYQILLTSEKEHIHDRVLKLLQATRYQHPMDALYPERGIMRMTAENLELKSKVAKIEVENTNLSKDVAELLQGIAKVTKMVEKLVNPDF